MTFLVSDSLKGKVTEASLLEEVYHEEASLLLFASFYTKAGGTICYDIDTITKSAGKFDIEMNIGSNLKLIDFFLKESKIG